ncbi:MAG TPA: metallopeptidase TldD-related protein [Candidatus Thermoplasmatota archaeon]|nr:metallopeptidase TldD-related protein [Candidatus Thermoplasmatota archaeon]
MDTAPEALLATAQAGVDRAKRGGADDAEVFVWAATRHKAEQAGGAAAMAATDHSGVGVRLAVGKRVTMAQSSGVQDKDVAWAVDETLREARRVAEDPGFRQFPDPTAGQRAPTQVERAIAEPDPERLLADVRALVAGAQRRAGLTYIAAALQACSSAFAVANARGVAAWDREAYEQLDLELRATGPGGHRVAVEKRASPSQLGRALDLGALGEEAARRAAEATSTQPLQGVAREVILDPANGAALLGLYSRVLSANLRAQTPLGNKLGQPVASPELTLREDPLEHGCRRQRVDDEGVPTQPRALVERGVLRGFLYDARTALAEGASLTGNGLRPLELRYAGTPAPRPANLEVEAGTWSREELIEGAERAVLVQDLLLGTFAFSLVNGDFSFVAPSAHLVEHGRVAHALPPTTVAGNLYKAVADVQAVGRERQRVLHGNFPAVRVTGITCAT